ncbi:hypothetical protein [Pectobacterium brasiliense]|uniref:hypothetical protein n=1 Tax=Pectobacterium brasiliense TaxID=180957 RepID=UPI0015DDD857|nr:hypothetical protein [Pectobacterium brasiliense]MBA0212931.1 hypothetical protein [Pectobacterium brasiliense]
MSKEPETLNLDCGGDCLSCMASHGDPDAIEVVKRLTGEKVRPKKFISFLKGLSATLSKGENLHPQ